MKKAVSALPEGYREILSVDLKQNKKQMLLVNGLGLLVFFALAIPVHMFYLPYTFLGIGGVQAYRTRIAVLFGGIVVYVVLHELVHGITMKICGTKKVKYGFTGVYAYAGSEDFYYKWPYIVIALAPVVVWGIVLGIINCVVSPPWFWVVYTIQLMNLSGAAGDLYVTAKFSGLPESILIRDYGVGMRVYAPDTATDGGQREE